MSMALRIMRSTFVLNQAGLCRAPKKKGGKDAEGVAQSTDIINIWKDKQDPQILSIRMYPLWLQQMARANLQFGELYLGQKFGDPTRKIRPTERSRYIKGLKRMRCKQANYWKHIANRPVTQNVETDLYQPFVMFDRSQGFETEEEREAREKQEALEEMEEDSDEEEGGAPAGKGAPRRGGDI